MTRTDNQSLADKLFPKSDEDENFSESILSVPPEQRRLHTETYDFSISTIIDHVKSDHIYIPEFQRRYVWTQAQASRLIESLIIQCPIPVIYLSQAPDERLSVIDGNQRIRSLERFIQNQFELRGLTAYPELEGLHFYQLDPRFQRHILNRTLRCIVIMKDTHPQVKFDVFERLNTGAVKLTPQELRHGIYHGRLMDLLVKLAKTKKWSSLFQVESNKRMRLEEFLLRMFALHYDFDRYRKPLSAFLNDFAENHRDLPGHDSAGFQQLFDRAVDAISNLYGDFSFKVFDKSLAVVSKFNAALFDAEVLAATRASSNAKRLSDSERKTFLQDLSKLFDNDEFLKTIGRATSDEAALRKRVQMVSDVVRRHI